MGAIKTSHKRSQSFFVKLNIFLDLLSGRHTMLELAAKHRVSRLTVLRLVKELEDSSHAIVRRTKKPRWEKKHGYRVSVSLTTKKRNAIHKALGKRDALFARSEVLDLLEKAKDTRDLTSLLDQVRERDG